MIKMAGIVTKEKIMKRHYLRRKEGQVYLDNSSRFTYIMISKFESRIPRSVKGSQA